MTYQQEKAPSEIVRPLHTLLTNELGLVSPLARAVEILDRVDQLGYPRQGAEAAAHLWGELATMLRP